MNDVVNEVRAEQEIRDLIEAWRDAVVRQDIDGIVAHYAPGVLAFDAIIQLQFKGIEAYRKHWEACFAMCEGPMIFDIDEVVVVVGADIAFSHFLNRCGGTDKDGNQNTSWMRATSGFRRIGGRWKIVHEHFSAPFDPMSGKAMFELQP